MFLLLIKLLIYAALHRLYLKSDHVFDTVKIGFMTVCVNMVRQWLVTFLKLIKFNINKQWVQDVVMRKFRFQYLIYIKPLLLTDINHKFNGFLFHLILVHVQQQLPLQYLSHTN